MRAMMLCLSLCAIACASRTPPLLPAPSSLQVVIERDVVQIPKEKCGEFGGWFAMTRDALVTMNKNDVTRQEEHDKALRLALGDVQSCGVKLVQAQALADSNAWHARWGYVIGAVIGFVVSAFAAAVIIFAVR